MSEIPDDERGWFARNRIRLLVAVLLTATYVNLYIVLSSLGDYYASSSWQSRYVGTIGMSDHFIWQPRFLYWEPFHNSYRGNLPGYLYSPLIRFDRAFWHRTVVP